ncbi:MAG: hypothetical protein WCI84_09325 [Bacteroidota bacterium]
MAGILVNICIIDAFKICIVIKALHLMTWSPLGISLAEFTILVD